jgi:hypothetical protein
MPRIFRHSIAHLVPAFLLPLLALATGCSSYGTITGKVTYQNRPLTGGTVLFTSTEGKGTKSAPIGADGSYTIEKMPTGPAKIAVETKSAQVGGFGRSGPPTSMQPPKGVDLPDKAKSSGIYGSTGNKQPPENIPDSYGNPDTSELTVTVTGGSQTHPIELK